jgi:hypothetical protein
MLILNALRTNSLASVLHLLNSRVIGPNLPEPEETMEVFYSNQDRTRKNIASTVAWYKKGHTVYRFLMQFTDRNKVMDSAKRDKVRLQCDTKLGHMMGKLDLCIGMPVAVTQNYCVHPDQIANGTVGRVWGFQFPDGASQQFVDDSYMLDGVKVVCKVPVDGLRKAPVLPDYVFIQIPGREYNFPGLPADVYPLPVYTKQSIEFESPAGNGRTVSTMVRQFGIVPAFARTFHKVQGLTLPRIIVGKFPEQQAASCMYVALSRATSLEGVFLRQAVTLDQAEKCKFDAAVIKEMNRLAFLEENPQQARMEMSAYYSVPPSDRPAPARLPRPGRR